jgi:signal transduction histidine kinase
MLVAEILDRKGDHLFAVRPDWRVRTAVAIMADRNIGTALVTDDTGGLLGILSERDLVASLNKSEGGLMDLRVCEVMTGSVVTCTPEAAIGDALSLMALHRIRHLPVVSGRKILGVVSIRDVLEFRLEALEEYTERLLHLEEESSRARAEADLANRAKTEFVANMSHELRTPLNTVIGFSAIIASERFDPDRAALYRQYANQINAAGRQLLKLVDEVIDVSKIAAGRFELVESAVDLSALLRECGNMIAVPLAERELTFRLTVAAGLPSLRADACRLRQVLLNLLSNAIKFSHVGGVVEVRAEVTDNCLRIAIIDKGVGMRPDEIPIALEPFRQIDSGPARAYTGIGLGLPLAKMLIEKHGGTLTVTSAVGEGTTVCLAIPDWRLNYPDAPALEESVQAANWLPVDDRDAATTNQA